MGPRKPPELFDPELYRQRSLELPSEGETRASLRDIAEHAETLSKIAVSHERWAWLRSLLGSTVTWAGVALALALSLRDEILGWFGRGGS